MIRCSPPSFLSIKRISPLSSLSSRLLLLKDLCDFQISLFPTHCSLRGNISQCLLPFNFGEGGDPVEVASPNSEHS